MILSSIEKLSGSIGYDIGQSNNEVQANLLNGFCKALHNSIRDINRDTQLCYIVDDLNNTSHEIIKAIAEFIVLKEKEEVNSK
jgi:hypothetical protein